jgi:hypothetical protein
VSSAYIARLNQLRTNKGLPETYPVRIYSDIAGGLCNQLRLDLTDIPLRSDGDIQPLLVALFKESPLDVEVKRGIPPTGDLVRKLSSATVGELPDFAYDVVVIYNQGLLSVYYRPFVKHNPFASVRGINPEGEIERW